MQNTQNTQNTSISNLQQIIHNNVNQPLVPRRRRNAIDFGQGADIRQRINQQRKRANTLQTPYNDSDIGDPLDKTTYLK